MRFEVNEFSGWHRGFFGRSRRGLLWIHQSLLLKVFVWNHSLPRIVVGFGTTSLSVSLVARTLS